MQTHEQISLHLPCFLYPHMQRYKKITIAREVGAHGVAIQGGAVDALAHTVRQAQDHIFFSCTTRADSARVFAAVARI